jgi:hypothetical protein
VHKDRVALHFFLERNAGGMPGPTEVVLREEGDEAYVFRRTPGSQRLYIYEFDRACLCFGPCVS